MILILVEASNTLAVNSAFPSTTVTLAVLLHTLALLAVASSLHHHLIIKQLPVYLPMQPSLIHVVTILAWTNPLSTSQTHPKTVAIAFLALRTAAVAPFSPNYHFSLLLFGRKLLQFHHFRKELRRNLLWTWGRERWRFDKGIFNERWLWCRFIWNLFVYWGSGGNERVEELNLTVWFFGLNKDEAWLLRVQLHPFPSWSWKNVHFFVVSHSSRIVTVLWYNSD